MYILTKKKEGYVIIKGVIFNSVRQLHFSQGKKKKRRQTHKTCFTLVFFVGLFQF